MTATCTVFLSLTAASLKAAESNAPRLILAADSGWKFVLADPSGAEAVSFADTAWRTVDLPHDWSIEGRPNKDSPTAGGGGFFPAGVGWYRKSFKLDKSEGERVYLDFDGVMAFPKVYINGQLAGDWDYERMLGAAPNGGGLIQAAVGTAGGTGGRRTKRSGWVA